MDELQPYCKKKDIRICMENLFDNMVEDMLEQWDWFMENYPEDFIGFCLDTGHANMIWHEQMPKIIRRYGERIFAVHIYDNDGISDQHKIPGEGTVNWEETMNALAQSAYELPLMLEIMDLKKNEDEVLKKAYQKGLWLNELFEKARK